MEVLDQTVWIHINYRTWQGKKTLTRDELNRYADPDKTPPEDLITDSGNIRLVSQYPGKDNDRLPL